MGLKKTLFLMMLPFLLPLAETAFGYDVFTEGIHSGEFIGPNEAHPQMNRVELTGAQGVLISVGTFRVIEEIADSSLSDIVFADYDHLTVEFNELNVELIRSSPDRFAYLAGLFEKDPNSPVLLGARSGNVKESELIDWLFGEGDRSAAQPGSPAGKIQKFLSRTDQYGRTEMKNMMFLHLQPESGAVWRQSFLGNSARFSNVQNRLLSAKTHFAVVDYASPTGFQKLAEKFRSQAKVFAAIDVSNLVQYFGDSKAQMMNFIANLKLLPTNEQTVLLSTINKDWELGLDGEDPRIKSRIRKAPGDWVYVSQSLNAFFEEIKKNGTPESYFDWMSRSLLKNQFKILTGRKAPQTAVRCEAIFN